MTKLKSGEQLRVLADPCPKCGGKVMPNYKHKWWRGKCINCSRVWTISREDYARGEQLC